ncbi:MAG: hypothetical protein BJ554DRAFT_2327 [Olpidium bornovanus]|uniref:Uncharacterized protein n=1 Tax=Olpidium bornovanus TaxID=278681 RepID=A0A8H8A151_9FUNG|nr:MAG: hypothetical protein BJ554DRAFT_2327 [Olpidium bornovanus]
MASARDRLLATLADASSQQPERLRAAEAQLKEWEGSPHFLAALQLASGFNGGPRSTPRQVCLTSFFFALCGAVVPTHPPVTGYIFGPERGTACTLAGGDISQEPHRPILEEDLEGVGFNLRLPNFRWETADVCAPLSLAREIDHEEKAKIRSRLLQPLSEPISEVR